MAEFTPGKSGEVTWYELATQDTDAAKEFYRELFGWHLEQSKLSPMPYDEIQIGDTAVGGMIRINEHWGEGWDKIPPHWTTYIAVDDVDATVESIKANGGSVCVPPFDAPNVGRMSVVADPGGAMFSIIAFVKHE